MTSPAAKAIVAAVLRDLGDRRGFRHLFETIDEEVMTNELLPEVEAIVDRLVADLWNERGRVDVTAVADRLSTLMGNRAATPYVNHVVEAIRALDWPARS